MCKSRELGKLSEAERVNQILIVLIGVQEQGGNRASFSRGWEGQPNFICCIRRGKSHASVRKAKSKCKRKRYGAKRASKAKVSNALSEIYKYITRALKYKSI